MTRPIKFRAWHNGAKYWEHWEIPNELFIDGTSESSDEYEAWGQFTGLKDSKGTEIYENDIVKIDGDVHIVTWGYVDYGVGFKLSDEPGGTGTWLSDWEGECEVIGNVHDNPDLLKESL